MLNIPNIITISRFLLIPVFIVLMLKDQYLYASLVVVYVVISDGVDGYIARKYNQVTSWGRILDPLADKLDRFILFVMIAVKGLAPHIMPLLILALLREVILGIGDLLLWRLNKSVAVLWYTKGLTWVFILAMLLCYFIPSYVNIFLIISVLSFVFTIIIYVSNYIKAHHHLKSPTSKSSSPSVL